MKSFILMLVLLLLSVEVFAQRGGGRGRPGPGRGPGRGGPQFPGPGRWNPGPRFPIPRPGPGRWNPGPGYGFCRVVMIDNWHSIYRTYSGNCNNAFNQCYNDLRFQRVGGLRCVNQNGNW